MVKGCSLGAGEHRSKALNPPSFRVHPTHFITRAETLELQLANLPTEMFANNGCHQRKAAQIIQDILFPHKQIHQITQTFFLLDFSQQQSKP